MVAGDRAPSPGADLSDLPGYRWVVQGQYDTLFQAMTTDETKRLMTACAAYLDAVLDALNLPDEGRALDLGCGAGLAALSIAKRRSAIEVLGVDVSEEAVALAKATAEAGGLANARFIATDAETPPDGPFDRLVALSVLNLLPDKLAALRAWRRVAAPDARIVIADGFTTTGPGAATRTSGALSDATFTELTRRTGWRAVMQRDLTPLVKKLDACGAWPWREYVRPGFRYRLVALEPRPLTRPLPRTTRP